MNVKQRIQTLAKDRGLSVAALERECELRRGVIEKWGSSSPSVSNVKKVADYLNTTVDYLCFGSEADPAVLSPTEQDLITLFRQLNTNGYKAAVKYIEFLLTDKTYILDE